MQIIITIETFIAIIAIIVFILFLYIIPFGLYFQCVLTKVNISLGQLIFMKFRKVSPSVIVNALINAKSKGLILNPDFLEAHFLAGGDVRKLAEGIIYAKTRDAKIENKYLARAELNNKNLKELIDKYIENRNYYGNDYSIETLI